MAGIFSVVTRMRDRISDERDEVADVPVAKLYPHVPNLVTFVDHSKPMPWTKQVPGVLMFADISGFTALCEKYSSMSTAGIDKLTRTLNEYLGSLVEIIIQSKGDVLKFAGDAILALWKTSYDEVQKDVETVVKCCIDIQDKCGLYETDIGVTLTVKMGVAAGDVTISFVGNDGFRHYVESGPAVDHVKLAEKQCQSGFIVLSPGTWEHCNKQKFNYVSLADERHVRVISLCQDCDENDSTFLEKPLTFEQDHGTPLFVAYSVGTLKTAQMTGRSSRLGNVTFQNGLSVPQDGNERRRSMVLPVATLLNFGKRRQSLDLRSTTRMQRPETLEVQTSGENTNMARSSTRQQLLSERQRSALQAPESMSRLREATRILGPMPKKLRLYVLSPVLKKLDDGQPLEYLSEMRQISVIFMNLSLGESADISSLMQSLFEIVYRHVQSLEGCLNKIFLFDKGCSFLVIFGLPGYKHEQDCAYALQCSVSMANSLNEEEMVSQVSIGVTTGTAFCGVIGHKNRHEYSVIGRKVNMAARLMMHYPGAITCDDETFLGSRLPSQAFDVVPSKAMKGLQNIGTLRQFVATGNVDVTQLHALKHFRYPLLDRVQEMETIRQLVLDNKSITKDGKQKQMIVIEADAGMGKTRLLDALVTNAPDFGARVVSCALLLNDVTKPYFLAQLLLRLLLTNAGFSEQLEEEVDIVKELQENHLIKYLPLLKLIMGKERTYLLDKASKDKAEWSTALHNLVNCIVRVSLERTGLTLFAVDDIQFADRESWELLADMQKQDNAIFVVTMKPPQMNQKLPDGCRAILALDSTKKVNLEGLDTKYMCALACQILDVVRIPRAIDRILVEKSHGVPSWCEQLLQDMCTKDILQIVQSDETDPVLMESTVAPLDVHITTFGAPTDRKRSKLNCQVPSFQKLKTGNAFLAVDDSLKLPGKSDTDVTESMKALLSVNVNENICILNPKLNPEDLKIPESVKDMMIARLDALRASEQMLVKCASVLDVCFYRMILIEILPNRVKKQRVDLRIEHLIKLGIFVCGGVATSQDLSTLSHVCDCKNHKHSNVKKPLCSILRFQNPMLRETVYGILLDNQRVNLHFKAASQLDAMANKYRDKVPNHILERDVITADGSESSQGRKHSAVAPARLGQPEEVAWIELDAMDCASTSRHVPLQMRIDKDKLSPLAERNRSLQKLLPIYTMIAHHWRSAGEKYKLVRILIEDTLVAIALEQPLRADSLLEEAKAAFIDFENTDKKKYACHPDDKMISTWLKAKLERLQGKVNEQENFTKEARINYIQALRVLGKRQPTSKRAVGVALSWKLRSEMTRASCQSCFGQSRHELTEKVSERLSCLSSLYDAHKLLRMEKDAMLNALQQLSEIRSFHCTQHQVIIAYNAVIEQYRRQKFYGMASIMENEFFQRLKEIGTEKLTESDLRLLAGVYGESSVQSLTRGALHEALLTGIFSAKICRTLELAQTATKYIPSLVQSQIMALKVTCCFNSLEHLRAACEELDDKICKAWFYCCCLDLLLDAGQPIETFQKCMMFICWLFCNPEGVPLNQDDCWLHNYLFMRFAVWNCRKRSFLEGDRWYQIAMDMIPQHYNNFFALQSQARHVECLLLTLCQAKKGNLPEVEEKVLKAVSKELSQLRTGLKCVPSLRPRFLHLLAYFYAQGKNWKRCQQEIAECAKVSMNQGNCYEYQWSQYNWGRWSGASRANGIRDSIWLSYSDGHVFDWTVANKVSNEVEFYPWPVPSKMVS